MKEYLIIKKKKNKVFKHNKNFFDTSEKAEISIAIKNIQTGKQETKFGVLEVGE